LNGDLHEPGRIQPGFCIKKLREVDKVL
jgi:hypothetical protein